MTQPNAEPHYGQRVGATPKAVARLVARGWTDNQIAAKYDCTRQTIWLIRRQFNIQTSRPAPCKAVIWPLPADVEVAWNALLGPQRFQNVALLSATTLPR
jgi:orotate phosphoribosyltransferase-like protein